jgi:hypothetical protein
MDNEPARGAAHVASAREGSVQAGVIATPVLPDDAVAELADELAAELSRRYPDVRWDVPHLREPLVEPPVDLTELVDATRARLLEEDWDLALCITELPVRLARRPLLVQASPTHGVAIVSLPALGVLRVSRRLREAAADAVGALIGDPPQPGSRATDAARRLRTRRRLIELATDVNDPSVHGVALVARVIEGNIRLLLGMIRANRPWRLAARLFRALAGALAALTFALIASDVWRMADSLDTLRLAVLTLAAIATAVFTLIAAHGLWESAPDPYAREQVLLFNIATLATVALGIVSLYVAVFVAGLAVAGLLIDSSLFARAVDHPVDLSHYLRLAWLASSLATVGGALGAGLESGVAVREAAYAYRRQEEIPSPMTSPADS